MAIKIEKVRGYEILDSRGNPTARRKFCFRTEASE